MVLLGTIVNVIAILIGTMIGLLFTNIKEHYRETVMQGIGLIVIVLGITMALEGESIVLLLLSMLFGALIGEGLHLEKHLYRLADSIQRIFLKHQPGKGRELAKGFVTATILFVVGAMSIIGALDSGIRGNHEILYTKSILDGFTSLVLASTLGIGVIFSAVPVFLYQGTIAFFASFIDALVPALLLEDIIREITALGGVLMMAIGLNVLGLTKIRVTNLLPSLLIIILLLSIRSFF